MTIDATAKGCLAVAGTYCGLGLSVPLAPTLIAFFAVISVRLLVWTKTKSLTWNLAVLFIAALGAFVTVENYQLNAFRAFWIGIGYGGLGVGIIEIGKGALAKAVAERFGNAASVLFGIKPKE